MLNPFGKNIWLADGPRIKAAAGFCYPTRMAVLKLPSGQLFVWSPVGLTDALKVSLAEIGTVRHVVAPNSLHDSFLGEWHAAYPHAAFHAAPGLARKRPDIPFETELSDLVHQGWKGSVDQVVFSGNAITTEVVLFHHDSGTVIFTDLLQQLPRDWFSGWRRVVARLDLMTEPKPTVPRKFRLAFRDRGPARAALAKIRNWPVKHVVMAHGPPVSEDAQRFLRDAFCWLEKRPR